MRHLFIFSIILGCSTANAFAQITKVTSEILSAEQVKKFLDTVPETLNIKFPIIRIYKYEDKRGRFYCVLTESRDEISVENDTMNYKIKAINFKAENGSYTKIWEIDDNIIKNDSDESSIWFWTKYCDFKDYDGDGLADPIIVYGTYGANGYDDGRIKIIIYYKGQKIAIRHQNGVLDNERETKVDNSFYNLPQSLQNSIKQKMDLMIKNNNAIFPYGWQAAMKNKKTSFSERR